MLPRLVPLVLALVLGVAAAPAIADAARVSVRVEGKTRTIFAPAPWRVDAPNALDALRSASVAGEFFVGIQTASFGPYVAQIGYYAAAGTSGWLYKVNGVLPPVGPDQYQLRDGDSVLWYWADLEPPTFAGPTTLLVERTSRRCYAAFEQDDKGARSTATGVRVWVAGVARFTSATGRFCVRKLVGLVRVTKEGAVRSNALA